ncbi:MAG: Phosphate metabolism transcription protein [Pycnora praestabilis]|nr:MAG: Phosphate metabolism transcription protein [Pycnora praestabilis]
MRFGKTLRNTIYEPWADHYIDYAKLKTLLREDGSSEKGSPSRRDDEADDWTDEDESAFVEELVNVQLEKVNSWQVETYKQLRDRTSKCESELETLVVPEKEKEKEKEKADGENADRNEKSREEADKTKQEKLKQTFEELESITKETNELEKFSRINFTGFLKSAKKHDRKRGRQYRVRPLLQVRLGALPFNSEDYSPLIYRLSAMYSFVRQNLEGESNTRSQSISDSHTGGESYTSHKFWVHLDNLLEVKTYILRRLPVLVYNPQTSKVAEGTQTDPTITSLYFDNSKFSLYTQKVDKEADASSLRLRWYGRLTEKPEILFEKKTIKEGDNSEEIRFPIKEKYVQPFIKGEYKMEKSVQKIQDRQGQSSDRVEEFQRTVDEIQTFIRENELQPVLRANYTRTAFQIPGDNRLRISLDTDLALIREDALDTDRPCRDPEDWHRADIDNAEMEFPFTSIRKGEIARFPFALLEIKVKDSARKKSNEWIADLMSSHLVKEAPRFSKFVHGVAQLFDDNVNSFPFWLSELETDIRRDPETAFEQEQEKKAKRAGDEFAVGSFLGSKSSPAFKPAVGSPVGKSRIRPGKGSTKGVEDTSKSARISISKSAVDDVAEEEDSDDDGVRGASQAPRSTMSGLHSIFPSFSNSKYAQARRQRSVQLPPGVRDPGTWIKDSGPVKVEPKVWLANQRTFIKWQHISVLLASLSLGLFNAAGAGNSVARGLDIVYTLIAVFAGVWGWWIYIVRSRMIEQRSGKDFDNVAGPMIVCIALVVALCLNFGFKYQAAIASKKSSSASFDSTIISIDDADPSIDVSRTWQMIEQGLG